MGVNLTSDDESQTDLGSAWAVLTPDDARDLFESLVVYYEEIEDGRLDPGWHTHIGTDESVLTIAVAAE